MQASRTGGTISTQSALARHAERRDQGIPTLTVLTGSHTQTMASWHAWLTDQGRTALMVSLDRDLDLAAAALPAWLHHLRTCRRRLLDTLAHTLAGNLPMTGTATNAMDGARLLRMSHNERTQWLVTAAGGGYADALVVLCEWLCQTATDQPGYAPGLGYPHADEVLLAGFQRVGEPTWVRVLARTSRLLGPGTPGLGVCVPTSVTPGALLRLFVQAFQLADAAAALPVAIMTEVAPLAEYLARAPENRITSRIRRSLIDVGLSDARLSDVSMDVSVIGVGDGSQRSASVPARGPGEGLAPMLECERTRAYLLQAAGGAPETMAALVEAAVGRRAVLATGAARTLDATADGATADNEDATSADDRARSAAERLLFQALQADSRTHGRFALNRRVDIRFGHAPMEVDLLCANLRVAVEVDGYYHFRDADAYRRDRRKDLLLQIHGFLVMRFLADDVVTALDWVMDTIIATMDRSPNTTENAHDCPP